MLKINDIYINNKAVEFCKKFLHSDQPKYLLGRTKFAESITKQIDVDGYIDDFSEDTTFSNKPIIPIQEIPNNALVVITVIGKPFIAEHRISQFQFDFLDYYSFYKYSGLNLKQIMFWDGMIEDIQINISKYQWIYDLLQDKISKNQFYNIMNFRLSYDLDYMRGFEDLELKQYFEDFLNLDNSDEVFIDIGAYDGYTTEEFIKNSPQYKKVFLFEPEKQNITAAKNRLKNYENISFYQLGLSNKQEILKFDVKGSSSKISDNGDTTIHVDKLDNIINERITFIKMDIEGGESKAIEGAQRIIKRYQPKLAISVYHKHNDFWRIPQQILNIRNDYDIYLRHYTEGISETIMFFIPKEKFNQ